MRFLTAALHALEWTNTRLLAVGRQLAWVLVALMVLTILLQVFMRYVVGSALPWPEEVARALMIWMIALVAGTGLRSGAFVAVDLLGPALPRRAGRVLGLVLLLAACVLLVQLFVLSLEFFERGFRTRAASFALSRAWIYLAMPVCFGSMVLVAVELALRELCRLVGDEERFPSPPDPLRAPPDPELERAFDVAPSAAPADAVRAGTAPANATPGRVAPADVADVPGAASGSAAPRLPGE